MSMTRTAALNQYVPGISNIGRAEARYRLQMGWVWAAATAVLVAVLLILDAPRGFRVLAMVPAAAAALGFIESALHFSAKLGLAGVYNFTSSAARTQRVVQSYFRLADQRKATLVLAWALATGAAASAFLLAV